MKKLLFFLCFSLTIPVIIVSFSKYQPKEEEITENEIVEDNPVTIRVLTNNEIIEMNLEEYLIGVISSEVPVSFEREAIKAQTVASRTYALKKKEQNVNNSYDVTDDTSTQVYSSIDKLKNRWGDSFDINYELMKSIVNETKGEYITYDDEVIYAFFFSTSNGYTEDNRNVFGMDLPYLRSVKSEYDEEETDGFIKEVMISKNEFYDKLGITNSLSITNVNRSDTNRVLSLDINGNTYKGREFQKLFGLRSNDFTIEEQNDLIKITTKGFGHGVGLSQYGANGMAKHSKTYKEILKYYYTGTDLKKL